MSWKKSETSPNCYELERGDHLCVICEVHGISYISWVRGGMKKDAKPRSIIVWSVISNHDHRVVKTGIVSSDDDAHKEATREVVAAGNEWRSTKAPLE